MSTRTQRMHASLVAAAQIAINDKINERIDVEYRMKTVYTPTVLQNVVCQLLDDITKSYAQMRKTSTKKFCRESKDICTEYMRVNRNAMGPHVFSTIIEKSQKFHAEIYQHLLIHQIGYDSILLNMKAVVDSSELMTVSLVYVCKVILNYILKYDRDANERYKKALWDVAPHYQNSDNPYTVDMLKQINNLLDMYGFPRMVSSNSTDMSLVVFDKKVKELVESKIINELMDAE